jgi:cytochrome b subunit of formate dehydrogenase
MTGRAPAPRPAAPRPVAKTAWLLFALLTALSVCSAQAPGQEGCSGCHDQAAKLAKSAHAEVNCSACHPKKETYPHPPGVPKPRCAECHPQVAGQFARSVHAEAARQGNAGAPDCGICHGDAHELIPTRQFAFRRAVPETCGMCHTDIAQQFQSSVHGKAAQRDNVSAPLCTDCHGEHSIQSPKTSTSPVHPAHIRETCASCHGDVRLARKFGMPADRIVSFDASYHGLAARAGSQSVANCASCHGTHGILPSSDPKSTIHPKNLPQTCGSCHPGAGQRFTLGPIHLVEGRVEPQSIVWIREIYLVLIPLVIGLMILHNGGDWLRKVYALRLRAPARPVRLASVPARPEVRMYPFERLQHALLLVSFSLLVWTGFALKYPDQWWAQPLVFWENRWPVRGWLHRGAAVVMMLVTGMHLLTLIFSPRLRKHWLELLPRRGDIIEGVQHFLYNLGIRNSRPYRSPHSYVEKAEYWAVVWGTFIMILTGIMLWANNLMLAWLPKVFLDAATAIHFYEAVLATLAIVVWHFYFIMLDPDVYPVDTAWLTGYSVRQRQPHSPEPSANPTDREEQHEQ